MLTQESCTQDKSGSLITSYALVTYKILEAEVLSGIKSAQADKLIAVSRAIILGSRFKVNIFIYIFMYIHFPWIVMNFHEFVIYITIYMHITNNYMFGICHAIKQIF